MNIRKKFIIVVCVFTTIILPTSLDAQTQELATNQSAKACSNHTNTSKHIRYVYYSNSCSVHYRYYLQSDNKTIKYAYGYNTSGQKIAYYVYHDNYDTVSNHRVRVKYYLKAGTDTVTSANKYDLNGNRISQYYYFSNYNQIGNLKVKRRVDYNTSGKWLKETSYTTSGNITGYGNLMTPLPRTDKSRGYSSSHPANDYAYANIDNDYIYAADSGKVLVSGWTEGGCGNTVILYHGNNKITEYCHMKSINVKQNQSVSKGTILGHVGSTGNSTGPHLHFGLSINGKYWYAPGSYQGNPQFANPDSYIKEKLSDKPGW